MKRCRPKKPKAKTAILRECENLAAAGVTFVAVHFDGYGDSGVTEEVQCFDSDYYAYEEHKPVEHDAASLQEHFETLVPMGYEDDCGGFGDVVLDASARKIFLLWDTRYSDSRREVVFDRTTEDLSKVQGLLFLQWAPD